MSVVPASGQRRLIVTALIVVLLVALMSVTARERERITMAEGLLIEMLAPLQRAAAAVAERVLGAAHAVGEWRDLRRELEELTRELEQYRAREHEFSQTRAENLRLARLLAFADRTPVPLTAARVIARNPDSWFGTLALDRGYLHGVARNMIAVTDRGAVGRIVRVTARTSTVLLLTDPDSGVGALVSRSREPGVVLGQAGAPDSLVMRFFSRDADVVPGDVIVTSGVGSLFPKGLVIGSVERITERDGQLMAEAQIRPAADLRRLEEVLVLRLSNPGEFDLEPAPGAQPEPLVPGGEP